MESATSARRPQGLLAQLKLIRRMFAFMRPVVFETVVTALIFIAFNALEVITLRLLQPAVDLLQRTAAERSAGTAPSLWEWITAPTGTGADLRAALFWLALARLAFSIVSWARETARTWHSMRMVYYMREAVYDRLQRVGFSFHDQHSTGTLINRALSDLQNVRHFVLTVAHLGFDIIFALLFFYAMLLYSYPPLITVAALIPVPFWVLAIRRFAILSLPVYQRQVKANDGMVNVLTENIAGVHVVRAFATEKQETEKFRKTCDTLLERLMEAVVLRVTMAPVIRGIAAVSYISLIALGAYYVQQGRMPVGSLLVIGGAMGTILARIQQINAISDAYQQAVVSSSRLFEILDSPDATPQRREALPLRPGGGAVAFRHVHFSYVRGQTVLEDISFQVPAGSFVALVGPTGSGKTTVANLLGRFYDADLGSVEIDGQDLRDITLRSVREAVGYVFQETYLFSDTIARNIAYGSPQAPTEQIKEAARISRAEEFIERLPDKYENRIGEYGATLSGGQKQRLAIARAILHNPRILVMDDALAAVDPETEAGIRGELGRIMKGRTVFMITSRISTARRADRILVIENGRITQSGTHAELLEQPGYYRDVAACQFGVEESEGKPSHLDRVKRLTASGVFRRPSEAEEDE